MVLRLTAFIALAIATSFVAPARVARACSCASQEREPAFEAAISVFEGRVTAIDAPAGGAPIGISLEVVRTWKGANAESIALRTQASSAACGYSFESGQSYLVYTHQSDDGTEWTGLCSRTRPIEDEQATADVVAMGAGVTPVDPTGGEEEPPPAPAEVPPLEQRANSGGCASCSIAGGEAGIAPILFGGLLLGFAFRRVTR